MVVSRYRCLLAYPPWRVLRGRRCRHVQDRRRRRPLPSLRYTRPQPYWHAQAASAELASFYRPVVDFRDVPARERYDRGIAAVRPVWLKQDFGTVGLSFVEGSGDVLNLVPRRFMAEGVGKLSVSSENGHPPEA